jgi:hypothetical protein
VWEHYSLWKATGEPGVDRHQTIDIFVVSCKNADQLLRKPWFGETIDEFVHGFGREVAFGEPIRFVDEKDLTKGFLEQLLHFGSSLSDILADHVGGRALDNFCLTNEAHVVEDFAHLLSGGCLSSTYLGQLITEQVWSDILPGGPLNKKLKGTCSRGSIPSAFMFAAVV